MIKIKKKVVVEDFQASIDKTVSKFGNSAHITIPKEYIGLKATVIIHKALDISVNKP